MPQVSLASHCERTLSFPRAHRRKLANVAACLICWGEDQTLHIVRFEMTYVPASDVPTHSGPQGLRFDFNDGARIWFPQDQGIDDWRVRIRDLETDNVLFDQTVQGGVVSSKRFYVRFGIEVWRGGSKIFNHDFDLTNRSVMIRMEMGGIGDHLAWIGAVAAFREKHQCRMFCRIRPELTQVLQRSYPDIHFVTRQDEDPDDLYASYKVLVFYNDKDNLYQPTDYRAAGLVNTASYILGVDAIERRPNLHPENAERPINEPYVCIATQASSQNKFWNNPLGWTTVVRYLKQSGYRVICINREAVSGQGIVWNSIPHEAEDQTGARPLSERLQWLRHADFFVGLSSGLSWLAWAVSTPVVLISGFTHPINEFETPYRVINWHACNSCSNDIRHTLDPNDYLWCPRHKNTDRMFECTRLITPAQVIRAMQPLISSRNGVTA
jgi:autotransporter strand-loop-strand O-heptosyltransferase